MAPITDMTDSEAVIRGYLLYLEDPNKLLDEAEIEKQQQAVEEALDPIDRLKALAELERVSSVDEEPLRQGFVQHAVDWAEQQAIPLAAFRGMGVPDEVLREAGFDVPATRRRGRRSVGEERQRAKSVPVEEVKAHILDQEGTFLLTDIQNGVGGSPVTVRKAVDELVEAGQVEQLGPAPDHEGRGRAPVQYRRVES